MTMFNGCLMPLSSGEICYTALLTDTLGKRGRNYSWPGQGWLNVRPGGTKQPSLPRETWHEAACQLLGRAGCYPPSPDTQVCVCRQDPECISGWTRSLIFSSASRTKLSQKFIVRSHRILTKCLLRIPALWPHSDTI